MTKVGNNVFSTECSNRILDTAVGNFRACSCILGYVSIVCIVNKVSFFARGSVKRMCMCVCVCVCVCVCMYVYIYIYIYIGLSVFLNYPCIPSAHRYVGKPRVLCT